MTAHAVSNKPGVEYIKPKLLARHHTSRWQLSNLHTMMGHFLWLLVLLTAMLNLSLEFQMTEQELKSVKAKFCGNHLSEMLSMVCNGVYNNRQKKNMYNRNEIGNRDDYQDLEPLEYSEDPVLAFPFRSRQHAKSIIPVEFRKRSHGVASECCHKSCTLWEMAGYCGDQ